MSGNQLRRIVLQQSKRANVGHIGSALSVADILAALYGGVLRVEDPADVERDRFVLSKGHAALALYAALHLRGWLAAELLDTYAGETARSSAFTPSTRCAASISRPARSARASRSAPAPRWRPGSSGRRDASSSW